MACFTRQTPVKRPLGRAVILVGAAQRAGDGRMERSAFAVEQIAVDGVSHHGVPEVVMRLRARRPARAGRRIRAGPTTARPPSGRIHRSAGASSSACRPPPRSSGSAAPRVERRPSRTSRASVSEAGSSLRPVARRVARSSSAKNGFPGAVREDVVGNGVSPGGGRGSRRAFHASRSDSGHRVRCTSRSGCGAGRRGAGASDGRGRARRSGR